MPFFTLSIKNALSADVQYDVAGGRLTDMTKRATVCEELGRHAELNRANMSKLIT